MRVGWVFFSAIFDQYVVISRERCILDTKLLWDGNRKPYANHRTVSASMTLSDCSYVNRANFSPASRGFVSDSWAFLLSQDKTPLRANKTFRAASNGLS